MTKPHRKRRKTVPVSERERLTGRAIAQITGIRPHTIYQMMASGEIPSIFINSHRVCKREDFEQWWAQYQNAAKVAPLVRKLNSNGSTLLSLLEFSRESGIKYDRLRTMVKGGRLPEELISTIDGRPWIVRERALEWARSQTGAR